MFHCRIDLIAALFTVTAAMSCVSNPRHVSLSQAPSASSPALAQKAAISTQPAASAENSEATQSALSESRLAALDCSALGDVDAIIQRMRTEVDAEFQIWKSKQPECWQEYRRKAAEEQCLLHPGSCPGLGIYGVGEGGGGVGYGIALGGTGTIGYGAGSPRKAQLASATNTQVEGVDEADIVKTDGRWVYLVANGALRIVEALKPRVVSVTRLPGSVRDMYLKDDRAVVFTSSSPNRHECTYGYDCRFAGDGTSTKISVYELGDRSNPKMVRQIELSGSLMASRRIGNAVHTVAADRDSDIPTYQTWPSGLETCGTSEKVVRERFLLLKRENEQRIRASVSPPTIKDLGTTKKLCDQLYRAPMGDGISFTSLISFDLSRDDLPATTTTVQSRPGAVFASADALYLSVTHEKTRSRGRWYSSYSSVDEVSEIHKFRISSTSSTTGYVGSGIVPGHVLNQFAMDEWNGSLRIVTSRGRVPDKQVRSVISVLNQGNGGNLVRVGSIDDIAPGEDVRAVRFDGDRGYVVTFKKTDPLFVLDLREPTRPAVLGELKIPGFSTYLHRIDPDHLLSIGFDANDHGSFAYFDGVILQLFDVKEPTNPILLHKEKIGSRGSSSQAASNHLAFNYLAETGTLAIPMTICEGGGDGVNGDKVSFSGLLVYKVDLRQGFTRLGGIDHSKKGVSCQTWWSSAKSEVKRSVFLDELVYSIATDRVKVQRLGHFGTDVADIPLSP